MAGWTWIVTMDMALIPTVTNLIGLLVRLPSKFPLPASNMDERDKNLKDIGNNL